MRFFSSLIFLLIFFSTVYSQSENMTPRNESEFSNLTDRDSILIIQDDRIKELYEKHISYNENKKGVEGYRIQIYSGSGGSTRKEAVTVRTNFLKVYPDIPVEIIYNEPYFKVRVGLFRIKSEGFKLFKELQGIYPGSYFIIENEMDYPPL